jgi:hypothetical protein
VKPEEHTQWVGAIITNLQALETVLRYFLVRLRNQDATFPKPGERDAQKTYMTRFLPLGKIIRKYNNVLLPTEAKFKVDESVLHIRDAFAHGRLVTTSELPARLWKFGSSKKGRVNIDFSEELTLDWMKKAAALIDGERQKVVDCFKSRGFQGLQ